MRVLGSEAVQDPTKVEAHVRAQMAQRQKQVTSFTFELWNHTFGCRTSRHKLSVISCTLQAAGKEGNLWRELCVTQHAFFQLTEKKSLKN